MQNLNILDLMDDTRGSEVEDAGRGVDCGKNGVVIKQINLEEAKAGFSSFHGF